MGRRRRRQRNDFVELKLFHWLWAAAELLHVVPLAVGCDVMGGFGSCRTAACCMSATRASICWRRASICFLGDDNDPVPLAPRERRPPGVGNNSGAFRFGPNLFHWLCGSCRTAALLHVCGGLQFVFLETTTIRFRWLRGSVALPNTKANVLICFLGDDNDPVPLAPRERRPGKLKRRDFGQLA